NVMVNDLRDERLEQLSKYLSHDQYRYLIITLVVSDDNLLKQRVLGPRDSGFRNFERAIECNRNIRQRSLCVHEHKLDNTNHTPRQTADQVLQIIDDFCLRNISDYHK
ncbi:unnamed protein product, partial [Didymodactylos carnosus]